MGNTVQGSRPAGGARRFLLTPHTRAHEKETRAIFSNVERGSRTDANYENQTFSENTQNHNLIVNPVAGTNVF
jgi:hypothetical protein